MKLKTDFVTNSSSSSFILPLYEISARQLSQLMNYDEFMSKDDHSFGCDNWTLTIVEDTLRGTTTMDNFSMYDHMKAIGVDPSLAEWSD